MTALIAARLRDRGGDRAGARVPVPAAGRVPLGGCGRARRRARPRSRMRWSCAIGQRAGHRRPGLRLPGRLRVDAVAGHRSPQGRDDGGPLHRRGGADHGGDRCAGTRRAEVLPFDESVVPLPLSPRDSVMTNARAAGGDRRRRHARERAAGAAERAQRATGDLVVIVSDNESWVDAASARGTATMREWNAFRARNPQRAAGADRSAAVRHDAGGRTRQTS